MQLLFSLQNIDWANATIGVIIVFFLAGYCWQVKKALKHIKDRAFFNEQEYIRLEVEVRSAVSYMALHAMHTQTGICNVLHTEIKEHLAEMKKLTGYDRK
jgi:hypothetical protein